MSAFHSRQSQSYQKSLVDDWNNKHPSCDVEVIWHKKINPNREAVKAFTRSPAWLMGGHTAMIQVTGQSGGVSLQGVIPIPVREGKAVQS